MNPRLRRPEPSEYAEYYAAYVSCVPEGDVLDTLTDQLDTLAGLVGELGPDKSSYRYAPGKWTAAQLLGHVVDTEWIFTTRALRFARGDSTALPGVDQNVLASEENFKGRDLASLAEEFRLLRRASLAFFKNLDGRALDRRGNASGFDFTVRALLWVIAGHAQHHLAVLRERYL